MRKIQYGSVLLDRYRGNILVSATKTNITIEKDGETYEAGTRNLPVGTYTVTATPKGTAELTTLEVNGNPFVSGGTVNIGFGGNLNVVAVSEGGELSDLTGTKWVFNDAIEVPENDVIWNVSGNGVHTAYPDGFNFDYIEKMGQSDSNFVIYNQSWTNNLTYHNNSKKWGTGALSDATRPYIEITGGTDVTNQALITWLQANAKEVIDSTSVTNLTNTTWVFKSTINTYEISGGTKWYIIGNVQNSAYPDKMTVGILRTPSPGQFVLCDEQENYIIAYGGGWRDLTWTFCSQPTLHITGGTDVSNETAINWMKQNAYLVEETE